jgi:hypothetical protein
MNAVFMNALIFFVKTRLPYLLALGETTRNLAAGCRETLVEQAFAAMMCSFSPLLRRARAATLRAGGR